MARTVLVVDDEEEIRTTLSAALTDDGYKVITAHDGQSAMEAVTQSAPDVIFLDVWLSPAAANKQHEGLDILAQIKAADPKAIVIIMSGHGNIEMAVKATKLGAYDFLEKPLSLDKILVTLSNALQLKELSRENESLKARISKSRTMVGESSSMKQLMQHIGKVAPKNSWVLITGENGTGKELVAHTIHSLSQRQNKPLIEVNCAAIPEELIESELFGHERGSFTGAGQMKRGRFEVADGGTLFLDEIADMSLKTQAKILRILQEQRFERVGGNQTISVDVRVIAATNKDLEEEIKKGRFREDLYHRLNVIPLKVPSLRDRKEDIIHLAEHFTKEISTEASHPKKLSPRALELLEAYKWPGNVRELKNAIERLVILSEGNTIEERDLFIISPQIISTEDDTSFTTPAQQAHEASLKNAKNEFEKDFILKKLKENDWNITKAANALGIERSNLHRKIKTYGLEDKVKQDS